MRKARGELMIAVVLMIVIALISVSAVGVGEEQITHTVVKGETVSLLCIQFYGYYSPELGNAFMKQNPSVSNINIIRVGQVLKFQKPRAPGKSSTHTVASPEKKGEEPRSLFEKRINATQGVVTWVEGRATIVPRNAKAAKTLGVNSLVYPGDVIETASDGRVELIINRESVVRLDGGSRLNIEAFRDVEKNKGRSLLGISVGTVWAKVKEFKDRLSRFEMELPTAIAGVHGTVYQASVAADASAEVRVYNGEVAVNGKPEPASGPSPAGGLSEVPGPQEVPGPSEVSVEQWTQIIRSMQRLRIDKDGAASKPEQFEPDPDSDWERWNEERDKRIAQIFAGI